MIRFNVVNGSLRPVLPADAEADVTEAANTIAQRLNAIQGSGENYKSLMQSLDQALQKNNSNARPAIDDVTIREIEDFYAKATGLQPWDSTKQGVSLDKFDPKFYSKQVPDAVAKWSQASKSVSFAGREIADVDIKNAKYSGRHSLAHLLVNLSLWLILLPKALLINKGSKSLVPCRQMSSSKQWTNMRGR
jgi:hypothetical protein